MLLPVVEDILSKNEVKQLFRDYGLIDANTPLEQVNLSMLYQDFDVHVLEEGFIRKGLPSPPRASYGHNLPKDFETAGLNDFHTHHTEC